MLCLEIGQMNYNEINIMKEQFHTFENENRRAEVFLTRGKSWLIECFEDGKNVQQCIVPTEQKAEIFADNWVLNVETKGNID